MIIRCQKSARFPASISSISHQPLMLIRIITSVFRWLAQIFSDDWPYFIPTIGRVSFRRLAANDPDYRSAAFALALCLHLSIRFRFVSKIRPRADMYRCNNSARACRSHSALHIHSCFSWFPSMNGIRHNMERPFPEQQAKLRSLDMERSKENAVQVPPYGIRFIFRTNHCACLSGKASVPEHYPQCGKSGASRIEYDTHGVLSSFQSTRDPCSQAAACFP